MCLDVNRLAKFALLSVFCNEAVHYRQLGQTYSQSGHVTTISENFMQINGDIYVD